MRFSIAVATTLLVCLPVAGADGRLRRMAGPPAVLAHGDTAPPFTLKGSDGRTYRLADFRGQQAVVVAWFAKPFSGG